MVRQIISVSDFQSLTASLIGLPISHLWKGYGSAIFLEFGSLEPRTRRDGSDGNPVGEWTLALEWSWRIEGKRRVWLGSWSDAERWPRVLPFLQGSTARSLTLIGRLPEIDLGLSNGLHTVSFMTSEGDPAWGLIKRDEGSTKDIGVQAGRLLLTTRDSRSSSKQ
jgi:hypothetical protein